MPEAATHLEVREPSAHVRIIDIRGEITAASEDVLMDAYARANAPGVRAVILSFAGLEYMNSGGIGLLVMLLVRAQRQRQSVLGYGLSDHYREIFEITRLADFMELHPDEESAVGSASAAGDGGRA